MIHQTGAKLTEGNGIYQAKELSMPTQVKGNMGNKGAEEVTIGGLWGAEEVVDKVEVIDDASEETPQRVGAVSAGHPGLGLGGKERVKKGSSLVNVSDGCFL